MRFTAIRASGETAAEPENGGASRPTPLDAEGIPVDPYAFNTRYLPSDPLFGDQWNLNNSGQNGATPGVDINVERAWDDYTGAGVTVGVWDDGVEYDHSDLDDNYDTGLHVKLGGDVHDPYPQDPGSAHGTAVAGIIAAENNGSGAVGVAFEATLGAVDIFYDPDVDIGASMYKLDSFDVTNHSWGWTTPFADNILDTGSGFWSTFFGGLLDSTENGRGGLGTINVVAAGNDRTSNRDANDSSFNNIPQTIAVAAVADDGFVSWYSTPGAAVLISAPSNGGNNGVTTTDRAGSNGYSSGKYTDSFGGTSAASPTIAGVAALILDANPNLGWRDVQDILAYSAVHTGSTVGAGPSGNELHGWSYNGADNWNGGGLHFSNDYGFGLVDATAAVRLAESWRQQDTNANWRTNVAGGFNSPTVVPDDDPGGIGFNFNVTDTTELEHVGLKLEFANAYEGDYEILLTSPSGTVSQLSTPFNNGNTALDEILLVSNAFRGESGVGTWTVSIADVWAAYEGTLISAQLEFYGASASNNDVYVFTNEFSDVAGTHGHDTVLTDGNGGIDTLNAAAVTSASDIDLAAGTATIDGVLITAVGGIDRIVTGDGDDRVVGDASGNVILSYRGNDTLTGGDGRDRLFGGTENDLLSGGGGNDVLVGGGGIDLLFGGDNNDRLKGGGGDDTLKGNRGKDKLFGGDQDDHLIGNGSADKLRGDRGDDRLIGGSGSDTAIYAGEADRYDFTELAGGDIRVVDTLNRFGTDILSSIEKVTFRGGGTFDIDDLLA